MPVSINDSTFLQLSKQTSIPPSFSSCFRFNVISNILSNDDSSHHYH